MLGKIFVKIGDYLCRNRKGWLVRKINRAIEVLYFRIENDNYDLDQNGEGRVINLLSTFNFKTVVDVGANHGDWSLAVKRKTPTAQIYAFEASPITYKILQKNLAGFPDIHILNLGLYKQKGFLDFLQNIDDGLSSLIPSAENASSPVHKIEVSTIDDFLAEKRIDQIDFLKVDTEGADYGILEGAHHSLSNGKIKVIQFEYGFVSVDTKNLLKDHYNLLLQYGYVIGKIYPCSVEFTDYNRRMENFIGPNFIAVRKDLIEIIQALR